MRLFGRLAHPFPAVFLVILPVTFVPDRPAFALERQDVGADAVEEPAVVADHHDRPGEGEQRFLQRAHGIDVQIVGRLVEQQQVGAGFQHLGEMDPVALAAGEHADLLLLVAALEVEVGDIGAAGYLPLSELQHVQSAGNFLPYGLRIVERVAGLVDIAELHRLADRQRAGIRPLLPGDHAEQGRLAGAVGADDADDAAGRHEDVQIVDQQPLTERRAHALRLDHDVAQARPRRHPDLHSLRRLFAGFGEQCLVGADPRLALGLARPRRLADPFELPAERALAGGLGLALLFQPLLFLVEPGRIVALPGNALSAVEFEDPAGDIVEEIAVVGDRNDGAGKFRQKALQPGDRFGVQMVGRLVEQQHVRPGEQQPGERDAPPLAAGQGGHAVLRRRAAQRVHRHLDAPVEVPGVGGVDPFLKPGLFLDQAVHLVVGQLFAEPHRDFVEPVEQRLERRDAVHDILADGPAVIQFGFLGQIADLHALGGPSFAGDAVVQPGHDPEQRGLAGAVQAEHADLGAGEEG